LVWKEFHAPVALSECAREESIRASARYLSVAKRIDASVNMRAIAQCSDVFDGAEILLLSLDGLGPSFEGCAKEIKEHLDGVKLPYLRQLAVIDSKRTHPVAVALVAKLMNECALLRSVSMLYCSGSCGYGSFPRLHYALRESFANRRDLTELRVMSDDPYGAYATELAAAAANSRDRLRCLMVHGYFAKSFFRAAMLCADSAAATAASPLTSGSGSLSRPQRAEAFLGIAQARDPISQWPSINCFGRIADLSVESVRAIASIGAKLTEAFPVLTRLAFSQPDWEPYNAEVLDVACASLPRALVELRLIKVKGLISCKSFAKALSEMTRLRHLSIENCDSAKQTTAELESVVSGMPRLEELDTSGTWIGGECQLNPRILRLRVDAAWLAFFGHRLPAELPRLEKLVVAAPELCGASLATATVSELCFVDRVALWGGSRCDGVGGENSAAAMPSLRSLKLLSRVSLRASLRAVSAAAPNLCELHCHRSLCASLVAEDLSDPLVLPRLQRIGAFDSLSEDPRRLAACGRRFHVQRTSDDYSRFPVLGGVASLLASKRFSAVFY
jgi:hypothetical protein